MKGPRSSSLPGISDESLLSFSTWLENNKSLGIDPQEHYRSVLHGIAGSPGVAIGPVYLHTNSDIWVAARPIDEADVDREIIRFRAAVDAVIKEREDLIQRTRETLGHGQAQIFESHVMLLQDDELIGKTIRRIRNERRNADYCFYIALQEAIDIIDRFATDQYFKERASDLEDVRASVLHQLSGDDPDDPERDLASEAVVVAHGLTPSDTARMPSDKVIGFVTDTGGPTSHASILARSMGIPAIVGCARASTTIPPGATVIVDGYSGHIYIDPDEILQEQVHRWKERLAERARILEDLATEPAETVDGHRVSLELNIELPDEIARMSRFAADGVGLFRTEFLFLARSDWPEENEQYEVYARLAEAFVGRPVTIRTMDVGGDKLARRLRVEPENNPFLGWRAIRISLAQPEVFRTQIRAILRASAHGDVRLMFPLVTSVEELRQAREHVEQAKTELDERNEAYNPDMPVGIMVETPASVMIADELAQDSDFFSIGTNDLVQYTLAVDRNNEHVAALFDTSHPAILRLINRTVIAGHRAGISVFVCGEMAHEPVAAMLLVGLGIDGLSMAPGGIPELKQLIRQFSLADAQQVAREALEQTTGEDVRNLVRHAFSERGILTP